MAADVTGFTTVRYLFEIHFHAALGTIIAFMTNDVKSYAIRTSVFMTTFFMTNTLAP